MHALRLRFSSQLCGEIELKTKSEKNLKDFRPRLDEREIRFLIFALENFSVTLEVLMKDQEKADSQEWRSKKKLLKWRDYKLLLDWKAKKRLLQDLEAWQFDKQLRIANDVKRRFEGLLMGRKPHPKWLPSLFLDELGFGTKKV